MHILARLILLFLVASPVFAQQEPFIVPVDFPLPGQLEVVVQGPEIGNTSYGLLDTQTGIVTPLTHVTQSFSMSLSPDFSSGVIVRNQDMVLMRTNEALIRSPDELGRVLQTFSPQERVGVSWSGDGQSLQKTVFSESTSTYRFEIYTLETGAIQTITSLPTEAVERALNTTLNRSDIHVKYLGPMAWNWRYPEWVAMRFSEDAGMFNIVTHEYISFRTVFPEPVLSEFSNWSADGTKLAMSVRKSNTGGGAAVVFTLDSEGNPKLRLLSEANTSNYQVIFKWLGVGDLLFTGVSAADKDDHPKNYIVQMIDGNWHEQLLFTASDRTGLGLRFRFTGTPEEEAALSCMFWDEVYPPHLKAGARGRVTFTDGTPSRLRADHSTDAAVVTQMAEGTTFEVTGASYCVDNYRWWPLRLDDGTVGWAAEGNPSEYWLEPVK